MNIRVALALLLLLVFVPESAAQLAPAPDRATRMDGHDALRLRADRILASLVGAARQVTPSAHRHVWDIQIVDAGVHDAEAFADGQIRLSARFVERLALKDDELAMLIAHEVAHVLSGDPHRRRVPSGDRMLQALFGGWAPLIANDRAGSIDERARSEELEADALGFELATRAGYPPGALRAFYRKVLLSYGDLGNAAHPRVTERMGRLETLVPASSDD